MSSRKRTPGIPDDTIDNLVHHVPSLAKMSFPAMTKVQISKILYFHFSIRAPPDDIIDMHFAIDIADNREHGQTATVWSHPRRF